MGSLSRLREGRKERRNSISETVQIPVPSINVLVTGVTLNDICSWHEYFEVTPQSYLQEKTFDGSQIRFFTGKRE